MYASAAVQLQRKTFCGKARAQYLGQRKGIRRATPEMHVPHAVRNTLVVKVWSMDVLAQMPFQGRRMYVHGNEVISF